MDHFLLQQLQQLRTQLFQTELQLQAANPGTTGWNDAVHRMQQVLKACTDCTAFAATCLYPLVYRFEPALIDLLNQLQNGIMAQHLALCLQTFPVGGEANSTKTAPETIRDAFDAVVLGHMQYLVHLQNNLLPVLQRYYSPEELQQVALQDPVWQAADNTQQKSEAAFRSQLYQAENEAAKAASRTCSNQQALAMHY
jgi:hypothetical protein